VQKQSEPTPLQEVTEQLEIPLEEG
jgi:hypothetical protein